MDAATKQRLLQQEFEALRPSDGGVSWAPPELLIPASQALRFLRRLAELDIALLSGVDLLELQPDHSVLVRETRQFREDRTLRLTEAARFVQSHLTDSEAMMFSYDVLDDIPWGERVSILRAKPSLCAQLTSEGQVKVTVTGAAALRASADLVWHHVRLLKVRVVGGETLELTGDSGRYAQLEQTTAWIRNVLTRTPDSQFYLLGEMLAYTSPLPEDQWLLPSDLSCPSQDDWGSSRNHGSRRKGS
ncbi:hypothetical protein CBQ26_02370 [Deinococcus indicus]|uniref:Uncharacterized protein n=1 Tax=Deinococcus indicus TaxID=223556 RepID=A0A246BRJ4_9DEIO|nr:hypothetical protein [Deinococcus indicus]OWL98306.1 hypothetical protein CBQ26_02370 [Deinococcus indicus]GHG23539.1 hypothetical protein GCM10017784_14450 [Deinococcus indicus]